MEVEINRIALRPHAVVRALAVTIAVLVIAHAAGQTMKHWGGHPTVFGLVPLFDLNREHSVPTFFAAAQLLFASLLLGVIAVLKRRTRAPYTAQWTVLAAGFLYMAFDEAAEIHEWLIYPAKALLGEHASGVLYFAWVVPGMLITLVVALWFLRFIAHLPSSTRVRVLAGALLFIGGALGVELIEGRHAEMHGPENLTFAMLVMVEETLEMAGIAVFIYAMLDYIERQFGEVRFRFAAG